MRPGLLVMDHRYRIRITTEFITGAEVLPSASVDYDGVLLRAARKSGGISGVAVLRRHRLTIRVGCPRRYALCTVTAKGLARKTGPAVTRSGHANVPGGRHKRLRLLVRPRYRRWVETHNGIFIRERRVADHRTHVRLLRMRIAHR